VLRVFADGRRSAAAYGRAMRGRLLVLSLALAVAATGCGGSGGGPLPLVVDSDLSSDDAVALLYLAQDRNVDLRAVTVSGTGLVHCPDGARLALELLAVAGRPEVPVACGAGTALEGFNAVPTDWRSAADGLFGVTLPPARRDPAPDAVELLRTAIEDAPREPTVLELAPMTNLASARRAHPGQADGLRIVAMGGAVDVPGNAPGHPRAETNAWLDPAAARIVLRSGAAVTLVPLDATNQVPVTPFLAQALARYHYSTPAATLASELVAATNMAAGGSYHWDPLAAVTLTRPAVVRTAPRRIDVAPDGRTIAAPEGASVEVVTSVDRGGFERELLGTLLGGARFAIPKHRVDGTLTLDDRGCRYQGATRLTAGEVLIDTVNRTSAPFQFIAGRLDASHTLGDLERFAETVTEDTEAPPWFTPDASAWTPPRSDMTWRVDLPAGTTGETVLACATTAPPRAWVVTSLPVFAARR
jgi:pyrimidine-specific ribonucleoside hydrolase